MLNLLIQQPGGKLLPFIGIMAAFLLTCLLLSKCSGLLPKDQGRNYAHDGKLSAGKPRGSGFLFVIVFIACSLLFGGLSPELFIYLLLVLAAMITGFLDDCSKTPWGEFKKGMLDLAIAVVGAITYLNFNSSTIQLPGIGKSITLNPWLFGILAVILIWVSINVTNCSDGVDGLSGTLTIITLSTFFLVSRMLGQDGSFTYIMLIFMICILAYLWFNATPSRLMMGDAGSRAMGLFIAIAALKTASPLLYILAAAMLILDGGLGLVKLSVRRFLKIMIMEKVRTPLHDHARKNKGWSNTQVVFRFAIIQVICSAVVIYLVL